MSLLIKLMLLAATAVIAGLVPALLFFQAAADRKIFIVGGAGVAGSYVPVLLGLPPLATLTFNGLDLYPVWALALAFPVALVWRIAATLSPPATEEERIAKIREQARGRAERIRRGP